MRYDIFKQKIALAKKMRISVKTFSNNIEHKKICTKCYHSYITNCILKGNEDFSVTFGGKYMHSFQKRLSDWCKYIISNVYRFYLIHISPNDDNTFRKYELIHYGVKKPVHFKIAIKIDEYVLEKFLNKNGFKIESEHLKSDHTKYDVKRI